MDIIQEAFNGVFPGREFGYDAKIKYSRKFKAYNANVKLSYNNLVFNLSREWKTVDREIRIGLIQELMLKILGKKIGGGRKINTKNMDLYNIFIKKVHLTAPKTMFDRQLFGSFERVNSQYFYGLIEAPNLVFGGASFSKLGSYEYGSDTITISSVLRDAPVGVLDYIMYHEMLHKKHKFRHKNGRSYHHTSEFKRKEKEYENKEIEKELGLFLRRKRFSQRFSIRRGQRKGFFEKMREMF